jgi:hypothetical protein
VLEAPEGAGRDRVRHVWAGAPRWLRAAVVCAGAGAVVIVAATATLQELTHLRAEQRLNDSVGISAVLDVTSSSMAPPAGRVDYSVTIHNEGPRRVRVTRVSIIEGGLRIKDRGLGAGTLVLAGAATNLPLSVRLDCASQPPRDKARGLSGVVNIRSLSGSLHRVMVTFTQASPLIDVAQTLCRIGPHGFGELSGPIVVASSG